MSVAHWQADLKDVTKLSWDTDIKVKKMNCLVKDCPVKDKVKRNDNILTKILT